MLFTNVRSIINKRDALTSVIDTCNADIIVLTETWLHSNIQDHEIPHHSRFLFYRCDRTIRRGGGVLLGISKDLSSQRIHVSTNLEVVCALVEIGSRKLSFCACYRPPTDSSSFVSELHDVLNILVSRYPTSPLFLLGDFNMPNIE